MIDPTWTEAFPGKSDDAVVWRVDLTLDDRRRRACLALLCDEERGRARRFLRAQDHDRFVASHAAMRVILAGALGTDPSALAFEADSAGKPQLAGACRSGLAFNLSHSGSVALVAVSTGTRIGVDVEMVRPIADCLRIAENHFSRSEVDALARLSDLILNDAFFACWTRKEAFVKAIGLGLSVGLDAFSVAVPPHPAAIVEIAGDGRAARAWSLYALEPETSYKGAVAIEHSDAVCKLRSLRPGWPY